MFIKFNILKSIYNYFPYLSGMIDEEIITIDNFLSIVLNKRSCEIESSDHNKVISFISLKNDKSKLSRCTPGVWKFTGNLKSCKLFIK